jgi:selenocysteine-specific elongation factor
MSTVIATAGHIDHGKTALLRALTGIDADRLPEERARGMTIDVGYAHMALDDGTEIDFVDVPGHDRLVGNMLVGAGEVDAWLLVVAADDGPQAQTLEHLELLHGLGLTHGLAVVTKVDVVAPERVAEVRASISALLARIGLGDVPVLAASAVSGEGILELRTALVGLGERASAAPPGRRAGIPRLSIDRVFSVRGRGVVVTGTLRGGPVAIAETVRILPDGHHARVREIQVHGHRLERSPEAGRVALNLAGVDPSGLWRGQMAVTASAGVATDPMLPEASRELLVALVPPARLAGGPAGRPHRGGAGAVTFPPSHGQPARLHLGTDQVDAVVYRSTRDGGPLPGGLAVARLRAVRPVAASPGDRFVLRVPSPAALLAGGLVLDARPPRGPSRGRMTHARLLALVSAVAGLQRPAPARDEATAKPDPVDAALLDLHGLLPGTGGLRLAADVLGDLVAEGVAHVRAHHQARPRDAGMPIAGLRVALADSLRRRLTATGREAATAADQVLGQAVERGLLSRAADHVRIPGWVAGDRPPEEVEAMGRLVRLLDVPSPPPLGEACRTARCSPGGLRDLEARGEIVRPEPDLGWSRAAFDELAGEAVRLAGAAPLTPARLRDATGTSRKYVVAILEELDRRGVLRRTPAGHVLGPRAPSAARTEH